MSDFAEALSLVLEMEGGHVDDPRDPGGRTNFGITQRTYDAWLRAQGHGSRPVHAISRAEVECIYRDDFARPLCFDRLAPGLAYAVLDAGVNSGPVRAIRWLQAALCCPTTGHLESVTLAAAGHADPVRSVERLCDARLGMMKRLAGWGHFGRGWTRRVAFVRSHALRMAQARVAAS